MLRYGSWGYSPGAPRGTWRFWALNPFLCVTGHGQGQLTRLLPAGTAARERGWSKLSGHVSLSRRLERGLALTPCLGSGMRPPSTLIPIAGGLGARVARRDGRTPGCPCSAWAAVSVRAVGSTGGPWVQGGGTGTLGCQGGRVGVRGAPGVLGWGTGSAGCAGPSRPSPPPAAGNGFSRPRSPPPAPRREARCRRAGPGRGDVRGGAAPPLHARGAGEAEPPPAAARGAALRSAAALRGGLASAPARRPAPGRGRAEPCAAPSMRVPAGRAAAAAGRLRRPAGAGGGGGPGPAAAAEQPCCWPRPWWCGNG